MRLFDSPFDSQHYGLAIGRIEPVGTADELADALSQAKQRGYDVVFIRLAEADRALRAALDASGHRPIDVLVTSILGGARSRSAGLPDVVIDHHTSLTEDAVAAIAELTAAAITRSHFHADPRLPLDRTRQLYATWARNDATGRAQRMITARVNDDLVGYISILDRGEHVIIDLVAVAPRWQGRGVGSALLSSFVEWIGDRDVVATVGTQADNPALALYRRFGFVPTETHFTYHVWST